MFGDEVVHRRARAHLKFAAASCIVIAVTPEPRGRMQLGPAEARPEGPDGERDEVSGEEP